MLSSDLTYHVEGYAGKARIQFLHSADGQNDRVTSPLNNHLNSETQINFNLNDKVRHGENFSRYNVIHFQHLGRIL